MKFSAIKDIIYKITQKGLIKIDIKNKAEALVSELIEKAKLNKGDILVVGCSSSEIVGQYIGHREGNMLLEGHLLKLGALHADLLHRTTAHDGPLVDRDERVDRLLRKGRNSDRK